MSTEHQADPIVEEGVRFASGPHQLAGVLAYPQTQTPRGLVTVAGPHPYLGGDMDNNVVRAIAHGLAEVGWATLRFDYAGQGASDGPDIDVAANMAVFWETSHAPDDEAKALDLAAAREFLTHAAGGPGLAHHAVAYSFGCWLTSLVLDRAPQPSSLVLIAPTVSKHDFSTLTTCSAPKLVITADNDFAYTCDELRSAFDTFAEPKRLVTLDTAEHFFKAVESTLVAAVAEFLLEVTDWCAN
jgi:uncharacterized protein